MNATTKILATFSLILGAHSLAVAAEAPAADEKAIPTEGAKGEKTGNVWDNLGFGLGLSYTQDLGTHNRVKSAELVNGVVRVTDEENGIPRIVIETHYFFDQDDSFGHGPFIAVQPGDQETINAVSAGYMLSFRRIGKSKADTESKIVQSWNIGFGVVADANVQTLGDGFKENQAPPPGETEIRYKEQTQYGLMILFSASL